MSEKQDALSHARLLEVLIYDPETGVFTWRNSKRGRGCVAGYEAGYVRRDGYMEIVIDYRKYLAHRLAFFYVNGEWPSEFIDHINMDRADNRLVNLREATNSQNMRNTEAQSNSKTGVRGVSWHKQCEKWQVRIRDGSKYLHVGLFDRFEDAVTARADAAIRIHGEFARVPK